MYVIIVGASKIGLALARLLIEEKSNVVIVEKDEAKAKEIAEEIDALVINGSGTEIDVLNEAGAEKANVIVSATSDDAVNLMVCELARMLGIQRRITLSQNPKHEEIFKEVGVEQIIYPSRTIAKYIRNLILRPGVKSVLTTMQDADIIEITIPEDALVVGRQIREIGMPEGSTIAAIHRNGELIIPRGSTVLKAGDRLTILAKTGVVEKVANLIKEKS
ncbi:MAG: TrkA family potassium uptake protein [Euryarchaeota archaeon]|nr:TrkA family potassium uptake protein [Euryarchaeota archaeon]